MQTAFCICHIVTNSVTTLALVVTRLATCLALPLPTPPYPRSELGVHEPPTPTAKLIADALGVPLMYLYCEDDNLAELLLALHRLSLEDRDTKVQRFLAELASSGYSPF